MKLNTIHCMDIFELCRHIEDCSVDMIFSDLPYGSTNCRWDSIIPVEPMWAEFKRIIKPNGAIVLTATQPFSSVLIASNYQMYRHNWVWDKSRAPNFLNANREPMRVHEDVLVFSVEAPNYYPQMVKSEPHRRGGANHRNNGQVYGERTPTCTTSDEKYPTSILYFPTEDNAKKVHPTQKPVSLFKYLIKTYTQKGDLVLDPCVGSGTTALAAKRLGRNFICGDSDPDYVDIALNRLGQKLTFRDKVFKSGDVQLTMFDNQ